MEYQANGRLEKNNWGKKRQNGWEPKYFPEVPMTAAAAQAACEARLSLLHNKNGGFIKFGVSGERLLRFRRRHPAKGTKVE